MKMKRWLLLAGMASALCLGANSGLAQQGPPGGGAGGFGGRGGRGNMDPAQFREMMMQNLKEQMEVTDDSEWKALQPLIEKVMEARRGTMTGMGGPMMFRQRGGNNNADAGGMRRGPQQSAEAEALQRAVDSKASNAELKTALAKVVDTRKAKQAELEKAQADLRKVLSVRQEAIATLNGLL